VTRTPVNPQQEWAILAVEREMKTG
jgi:hypothetical protein